MAEWLGVEPFGLPPAAVDGLVGRSLAGRSLAGEDDTLSRPNRQDTRGEPESPGGPRPRDGQQSRVDQETREQLAGRILLAEALAYGPDLVAVRQESWKLIATRAGDVFGLYDLATDPKEKTDLTAARSDIARHLLAHLAAWRAVRPGDDDPGSATSWDDVDATVRQRLKDLGYTD
jgi:hypothetical protein